MRAAWAAAALAALAAASARGQEGPAPAEPRGGYAYRTPASGLFSAELPVRDWSELEIEEEGGTAFLLLGPAAPGGAFRAVLSVRARDWEADGPSGLRRTVEALRRGGGASDREASPARALRLPGGPLARTFEIEETRLLPEGSAPAREEPLHHDVAVIPSPGGYFIVRLVSPRDEYIERRETFRRLLRTFRPAGPR